MTVLQTLKVAVLALAMAAAVNSASAQSLRPVHGFTMTDKNLSDLLAEGFDLKGTSMVMTGLAFVLQKGTAVAVCIASDAKSNSGCMLTVPASGK